MSRYECTDGHADEILNQKAQGDLAPVTSRIMSNFIETNCALQAHLLGQEGTGIQT